MCVHSLAFVNNTVDLSSLSVYDSTLDNCDYVDVDKRLEIGDSDLGIFQLNVRGLVGKSDLLKKLINENFGEHPPDVLLLCETWMSKKSPQISFKGYNIFETRRSHKRGGGTCVLVKNTLQSRNSILKHDPFNCIEYTLVECKIKSNHYVIGSLYRAPNTNQREFISEYNRLLKLISTLKPYGIILGMDHNLDLLKNSIHSFTHDFVECNVNYGLMPTINRPTRITRTSATLIDNIFVSENFLGKYYSSIIIDDLSDHLPCVTILENEVQIKKSKKKVTSRDLRPKHVESLKSDISKLLYTNDITQDTNQYFKNFHDDLCKIIEQNCPIRTRMVPCHKFRSLPWITPGLLKSMGQSKRLYQQFLSNPSDQQSVCKYKEYRNMLNKVKRVCKTRYYQDKCVEYKRNTKKLWQLINNVIHKSNDKSDVIDCIKANNIEIYGKTEISNKFGEYFSQLGETFANKIRKSRIPIDTYLSVITRNSKSIFTSPTNEFEIRRLIGALPNKKSSGHDNIDNVLLKQIAVEIAPILADIFNQSLLSGVFPDIMKLAEVVPLFKNKDRMVTSNYRPISLLITLSKILEKIVYKRTYSFLQKHRILYKSQYGFRSAHSCENAITELVGHVIKEQEMGKHTAALFLDLSKAFDTLEHKVLLKKLEIYGIRGSLLDWFESYLHQRKLMAKCNNTLSQEYNVSYGTPQGSILGPLLFIIFCNDLNLHLTFLTCIQFADDTTLYCSEKSLRLIESNFNHDIEIIYDWFCANKLTLNASKSVGVIFRSNIKDSHELKIMIGDTVIKPVTETKFLGLWLDDKLNWNKHYSELLIKLNQGVNLLRKAQKLLDKSSLLSLYYAHFHSHLTYAMVVWSGMYSKRMLNKFQKLQNRCKKIMKLSQGVLISIEDLIKIEMCKLGYKTVHKLLPENLNTCLYTNAQGLSLSRKHSYNTRNKGDLRVPIYKRKNFLEPVYSGIFQIK